MNERLRELKKQSTNPNWDGDDGPANEFNPDKFAELIVRECAEIAMREDHDPAECIKRHFGVKE